MATQTITAMCLAGAGFATASGSQEQRITPRDVSTRTTVYIRGSCKLPIRTVLT